MARKRIAYTSHEDLDRLRDQCVPVRQTLVRPEPFGGKAVRFGAFVRPQDLPGEWIEFDDLQAVRGYDGWQAYGHSKLANVLFALHLGELLKGTRITANALHPGVINTEIDRNMNRVLQTAFAAVSKLGYGKTIEQGAATSCFVATSPILGSTSGRYFEDCNAVTIGGDGHMHDEAMAAMLWRMSEDLTRNYLVTHKGPDLNDFERTLQERNAKRSEEGS